MRLNLTLLGEVDFRKFSTFLHEFQHHIRRGLEKGESPALKEKWADYLAVRLDIISDRKKEGELKRPLRVQPSQTSGTNLRAGLFDYPMDSGTICKSCLREISDGEPYHYRYNERASLLEPVHDRCPPKERRSFRSHKMDPSAQSGTDQIAFLALRNLASVNGSQMTTRFKFPTVLPYSVASETTVSVGFLASTRRTWSGFVRLKAFTT